MTAKIFIDGEAGTTGLQIRARLEGRKDLSFIQLGDEDRKTVSARRAALNEADVAILCLPDAAAREAVSLLDPAMKTTVIDASTAHRVSDGWVYGFPEYDAGSREAIRSGRLISNPGCYAITSVAMVHPLTKTGLLPGDWPLSIHGVSGYSGGGKQLIASFEDANADNKTDDNFRLYALGLAHKHLPEIRHWGGLARDPLFVPSVGRFAQGMIVQIPLPLHALPGKPSAEAVHETLEAHYGEEPFVTIAPLCETLGMAQLQPEALNGTNELRLHVFANPQNDQALLVGLLDNLGKGASGQAVQTLNLVLGVEEATGLAPVALSAKMA